MPRSVIFNKVPVDETGVLRFAAVDTATGEKISVEDWIRIIVDPDSSDPTIEKMMTILKDAPFKAYRFETPGVSPETVSTKNFEFAVVDDLNLYYFAATPRPVYFEEHLSSPSCDGPNDGPSAGCVFQNLGGDATLVAPRDWSPKASPGMYSSCYGHLANFVRGAPELQVLNMWKILGKLLTEKLLTPSTTEISKKPLWFSTAGTGVPYLHFRLDNRPKYYHYDPFKEFS